MYREEFLVRSRGGGVTIPSLPPTKHADSVVRLAAFFFSSGKVTSKLLSCILIFHAQISARFIIPSLSHFSLRTGTFLGRIYFSFSPLSAHRSFKELNFPTSATPHAIVRSSSKTMPLTQQLFFSPCHPHLNDCKFKHRSVPPAVPAAPATLPSYLCRRAAR